MKGLLVRIFNSIVGKIIDAIRAYVEARKFKEKTDELKKEIDETSGAERIIERNRDEMRHEADKTHEETERMIEERDKQNADDARDRLKKFVDGGN